VNPEQESFTGRTRKRTTRPVVHLIDSLAKSVITIGGIGTIVAVSTVALFLVVVIWPLFKGAEVSDASCYKSPWPGGVEPVQVGIDEYQVLGWALLPGGRVITFDASSGKVITARSLAEKGDATITAVSVPPAGPEMVLGMSDGSVRLARLQFKTSFMEVEDVPEELAELKIGEKSRLGEGIAEVTPLGQFRVQKLEISVEKPSGVSMDSAIVAAGHTVSDRDVVFAMLGKNGKLRVVRSEKRENMLTGKESLVPVKTMDLPLPPGEGLPRWVRVSELGVHVFAVWESGRALRFNMRDVKEARVAEELDLTPEGDARLTALHFMIGETTLISGDSTGTVRAWFPFRNMDNVVDGWGTAMAHRFRTGRKSAVTSLASSPRSRIFACGFADGSTGLYFMTSEKRLALLDTEARQPVVSLAVAPKDNGLVAASKAGLCRYDFDPGHPEATFRSLFLKIWYEGYDGATWKWQSSSGFKGYEMKLSLIPLILGTIKATIYSLLLGAPLALLAAIFSSELLDPKVRARVKPTIELMASLPSVVLGFVAALVFAPIVQHALPSTLMAFFTIPFAILAGAYVWQALPRKFTLRMDRLRLLFILPVIALGSGMALLLGPVVESVFFAGNTLEWLSDPAVGSPLGAWALLLLPLSALAVAIVISRTIGSWMRSAGAGWPRGKYALLDAAKFLGGAVGAVVLALVIGSLLSAMGFDPRTPWALGGVALSPIGTYVQRNALVVGFVMGFLIIPIIYTISEDALSAVPDHLRSASLGAGATRWQTAVRIVVPTAMSGLFSALMIGLGRAVGETMVVLMAAGNTPVLEMNVFNGFRTLSANIATELPEAVRDSTHYRTLFLAALTLFAMTFVINTAAELVRLRFRKKALEL